jgi:hypothetical protein
VPLVELPPVAVVLEQHEPVRDRGHGRVALAGPLCEVGDGRLLFRDDLGERDGRLPRGAAGARARFRAVALEGVAPGERDAEPVVAAPERVEQLVRTGVVVEH